MLCKGAYFVGRTTVIIAQIMLPMMLVEIRANVALVEQFRSFEIFQYKFLVEKDPRRGPFPKINYVFS